jgi:holo-[acyl-carrier protein] synthase
MIGIDIVKVERIERMIYRFKDKALQKYLSDSEIKLVKSPKTAAGFWATKEACSKALGTGIGKHFSFFDVEIYKNEFGAPKLKFKNDILKKFDIEKASLSITHDGEYAIAVVVLL